MKPDNLSGEDVSKAGKDVVTDALKQASVWLLAGMFIKGGRSMFGRLAKFFPKGAKTDGKEDSGG